MQESERFRESEEGIRFRARSILSIPLFSQGDALGVLNFGGDAHEASFTPHDRDLVVTLGRHVAVALEKARLVEGLKRTVAESIRALAGAIEAKDHYTRGHSDRVTHYSTLTAQALGMGGPDLDVLVRSAILHDVGKIGVPEAVLHKPGRLNDEEFGHIQRHPAVGVEIVREILAMHETLPIIQCHHERYDGRGYPGGVEGDAIPLGARILAVADTFDAMTSDRPYRKGLSAQTAFEEIERCSGAQFDPAVARAFLEGAPGWPDAPPAP
jgi:putative nucleotidyltransferase with HDIG domain